MNETKVNTKNPAASRAGAKKIVVDTTEYDGSFAMTYGRVCIARGESTDHLAMRAGQLSSLLMLIHGEGLDHFQTLVDNDQQNILWLAHQLSTEIEEMVGICRFSGKGAQA